ncbi:MAG: hypothetical protein QNJ98_17670 [Planctomycetota bacterium]|nr:hypothetical protein [Planctomycetota bacterium]
MRTTLLALLLSLCIAPWAVAEDDPLDEVKSLIELGQALIDAGVELEDEARMAKGLAKLKEARTKLKGMAAKPGVTAAEKNRIERYVVDVEARLDWYDSDLFREGKPADPATEAEADPLDQPEVDPEVQTPPLKKGEQIGTWCRRVMKVYDATESGTGRAALARQMAWKGGVNALPTLFALFDKEEDEDARVGIHEALTRVGTSRVSRRMAAYAKKSKETYWDHALDVIYRALERPERFEPERPWMRAVRAFHKLKNRELTLGILTHLDGMGGPGIAALGEVIYVDDFGYHEHTIRLLSKKRDTRAVPPLVHKMNRFKFEGKVKLSAHKALLEMGWYAVPELVNRLNDRAAGIWISWTLRKITGETMGTDRRKWSHWWMKEKIRHPELFDDPDERPAVVTGK